MRVLVTGGGGYIGSVLCGMLLDEGFDVTVLDRFFFGKEILNPIADRIKMVQGDVRWVDSSIMQGIDAIVDMAALSNDPMGELEPEKTIEINSTGRIRIANMAKKNKVQRYLLASSCSVYGFNKDGVTEESAPNPLTVYGKANVLWEQGALPLADKDFCVTALRQSSVYGPSNRMRFDISLNNMVLRLFKGEKLRVMRDGKQCRPIIYVKDTANAFITILKAEKELVNKQIFNVGSNDQNISIFDLAKLAAESTGKPFDYEWYGDPDGRSYVVNFDKIKKALNYSTKVKPAEGAKKIFEALQNGTIKDEEKTITIQWYKKLMEMNKMINNVQIDGRIL